MQTLFFATKDDLVPIITAAETEMPLTYVLTGLFPSAEPQSFEAGSCLRDLGIADQESAVNCVSYLVMPRGTNVVIRRVDQIDGGVRYAIDQKENPDSIQLQPGGAFSAEVFLHGRIATISATATSVKIYKCYRKLIKMRYIKVKAFFVSQQCVDFFQKGVRLTIAAQSPRDVDLVMQ